MTNYLLSNVSDRQHSKIYKELGAGALFDLEASQHGWSDFVNIEIGDNVFVINKKLKVVLNFEVTKTLDNILLEEAPDFGHKVVAASGGDTRVVFGKPYKRIDQEYSKFVRENNIQSSKLNPKTYQMYQGFNCAVF